MKQWKCIQCGALFTTPTDAQPFPMTCDTCRASNPPSHAQFLRPPSPAAGQPANRLQSPGAGQATHRLPSPGGGHATHRTPSPGGGQVSHRAPSPRGGMPGPLPMDGPIPLPGAPEQKIHTSSVTQMLKRSKTRTHLPAVPPPIAPPPLSGRRRSTSVVGGIAQQAADHRAHDHPPAKKSGAGNKLIVIMFLGAVVAVIGIGIAIVIGMENPGKTTRPPTDATSAAPTSTPTPNPATAPGQPQPAPTGTAATPPQPPVTPPPLTPYEQMQRDKQNNPQSTPPPIVTTGPVQSAPPPPPTPPKAVNGPTQKGKLLLRADGANETESGGRWRRTKSVTVAGESAMTWDPNIDGGKFMFFQWEPLLDAGSAAYVHLRFQVSGITQPNIVLVPLPGNAGTRMRIPTPIANQGQWQDFETKITLVGPLEQFEIRTEGDAEAGSSITIDYFELYAADPIVGAPAPQPQPGPTPAGTPLTLPQIDAFMEMIRADDTVGVKQKLADNPAYLTSRDGNDYGAMHWAARRGNPAMIKFLVDSGLPVDALQKAKRTPLEQAAEFDVLTAVTTLLDLGANINAVDDENRPPLFWAVTMQNLEVVVELLKRKADPNIPHHGDEETVLHTAARMGDADLVKALLAGGADPKLKNASGQTPAQVATAANQAAVAELIAKAAGAASQPAPVPGSETAAGVLVGLDGVATDLAHGRRWQNGTLKTEAGTTFAGWTRNAAPTQPALQWTDNNNDIVDIPTKVKFKARIRLIKVTGTLTIKLYTHQGKSTEQGFGAFEYRPKVADGEWGEVEGEITGAVASPLRTIEFKVNQAGNGVEGTRVEVDSFELLAP